MSSKSCRRLQVHHSESVLWRTSSLCSPEFQEATLQMIAAWSSALSAVCQPGKRKKRNRFAFVRRHNPKNSIDMWLRVQLKTRCSTLGTQGN